LNRNMYFYLTMHFTALSTDKMISPNSLPFAFPFTSVDTDSFTYTVFHRVVSYVTNQKKKEPVA